MQRPAENPDGQITPGNWQSQSPPQKTVKRVKNKPHWRIPLAIHDLFSFDGLRRPELTNSVMPNDPSSATQHPLSGAATLLFHLHTGRNDCNRDALAGFAAAHG